MSAASDAIEALSAALGAAVRPSFDLLTEAGRTNRRALSGAVRAALEQCTRVAVERGSIEAEAAMRAAVEDIVGVLRSVGVPEGDARSQIEAMGLTEERIAMVGLIDSVESAFATSPMRTTGFDPEAARRRAADEF